MLRILLSGLLVIVFASCTSKKEQPEIVEEPEATSSVVEVVSTGMNFDVVSEIPSGWTTFSYVNNSEDPHFFVLEKMPDTVGLEDYKRDIIPPFIAAANHLNAGNVDLAMQEFARIPPWFEYVTVGGGVGLTSAKSTSESTIFMEPGTYVMECYVRMPNGMAHALVGMTAELRVTEELNEAEEPSSDFSIKISSESGISCGDSLQAGSHTFQVNFEDQMKYEHMLGHDVNLVKRLDNASVDALNMWVNAANFGSFRTPAPKGWVFLGGVEDSPAGSRGYFTADLEPGEYLFIAEIPNASERGMIKTLTVY